MSDVQSDVEVADWLLDDLLTLDDGVISKIASMSLAEFCEQYLYVQDKSDRVVPLRLKRAQRHFAERITDRNIILKARQLGFSTIIQAFIFKRVIESSSRWVTMAHDDDTTAKLRRMAALFFERLPNHLGVSRRLDNAGITSYSNGSEVTITSAGSQQGGRGGTYGGGFHWSEVAFTANASKITSGVMQGVSDNGVVFLESTPNGAGGFFYNAVMQARSDESQYTLHFYPWWWDEDYQIPLDPDEVVEYTDEEQKLVDQHNLTAEQIKWRRKKKSTPGLEFRQEYPEDIDDCFVTSGESAFPGVQACMQPAPQSGPVEGDEYVGALDWGQDNDHTALSLIDKTTSEEVYLNRWRRLPYKTIRKNVIEACQRWGVKLLIVERNSMSSNVEALIDEIAALGLKIEVQPIVMTNTVKHELVTDFKKGYQEQGMKLLDTPYGKQELNIFVKKQTPSLLWTYAAMTGKDADGEENHDDTVVARLFAWRAAQEQPMLIETWNF
jgi:hypothetical protein